MFGFRFKAADSFGLKTDDGNWTGLVGLLSRGEADVAPAQFSVTPARKGVISFLDGLVMSKNAFVYKRQLEGTTDICYFFNRDSLWGLAVVFSVACLISMIAARFHSFVRECSTLSTFGAMVNQGVPAAFFAPMSMKIFFITLFLFGLCLAALFSARLSSLLTVTKTVPLATSFHDVLHKNLDLIIPGKTFFTVYFGSCHASTTKPSY